MAPILSICIPTYNRAELLRLMLRSLAPQVAELDKEVELIVSDNCSPDHTRQVVQEGRQYGPIRYHRNERNLGVARNMLILTNNLAGGEFCCFLGDDDMLVKGKLGKIVHLLESEPASDYFFVNYFFKPIEERRLLILEHDSVYTPLPSECMCSDFSERYLRKWEDLFSMDNRKPPEMFTAVVCHVFRRSMWAAYSDSLCLVEREDELFSSLDTSFPHIKVLAHAMVGRPAYYIGDPCILLGQGRQEWLDHWPAMRLVHLSEALDLYERLESTRSKSIAFVRHI